MQAKYRIKSGLLVDSQGIFKIVLQEKILVFWYTLDYEYAFSYDQGDIDRQISKLKNKLHNILKVRNTPSPTINIVFDAEGNEINV